MPPAMLCNGTKKKPGSLAFLTDHAVKMAMARSESWIPSGSVFGQQVVLNDAVRNNYLHTLILGV